MQRIKVALLTAEPNADSLMYGHVLATDEKRPPTGIGYLYSILTEKGVLVDIFDRYCGNDTWPVGYDVYGIYCATVCTNDIKYIIDNVDSDHILVGGPHASLFPGWFQDRVSTIVQGEAENIIYDLVAGNIKDKIVKTPRLTNEELDNLPRFPYELFAGKSFYRWDFPFYKVAPVFTLNTSRSCIYDCSFCSTRKIWGRKYTYMSADRVISDIEYVVNRFGAKGVYFREDNFTLINKRVVDICEKLLSKNIKVFWACETRVDTVDENLIKLMKSSGCVGLYVGVEHLSQRMLDIFNKRITVEQIVKFFEWTHKYNINTAASLIRNHPEETDTDRSIKYKMLRVINPTMHWDNDFRQELI